MLKLGGMAGGATELRGGLAEADGRLQAWMLLCNFESLFKLWVHVAPAGSPV